MAEDDQVHGGVSDELAERLGQAPLRTEVHPLTGRRKSLSPLPNASCLTARIRGQNGRGRLLSELAPFMNLLPAEIILSTIKDQELLRTILLDVGRHAYAHLVKYLETRPGPILLGSTLNDFIPPPPNQLTTDQMVVLSECLDDAVDSIRDIANNPNFMGAGLLNTASREVIPVPLRMAICLDVITPEMAATALTLLTASAFRRPPTRMVESMMAASQESQTNGVDGEGREGTEEESVPPPPASDDSLLGLACSTGLWELAMLMVRIRKSGDFMGEAECTPLMEACAAGHEKIVRQMIPYSANLNAQSVTQNTALIYASAAGHLDCVDLLLQRDSIDIDIKNENGHCALMEAASGGHLEIVKVLVEAGSNSVRMNVNSEFKESPLTLAAYKGHKDVVEYLLTLDLGETREEELHTALMEAAMDGHLEVAEILLKAGAPVNLASDSFESPLTLAACGGHTDLVKLLLDAGASIEEPNDESYTPLMEAAREGHADVVRVLLEAGAAVNAQTEETGETAMTLAACGGFTEIVEMILDAGGDLEAGANTPLQEAAQEGHLHTVAGIIAMMKTRHVENDQVKFPTVVGHVSTALAQAADNGHYQIVKEIGSSGYVDLNYQTDSRTALMKAAKSGYRDIIKYLITAGADVNARAINGDVTALSLACAGGHYECVAELLECNADPNVILKDGVTCVLEAARHGYVHIVELLLDYRGGGLNSGPKPNRKVATPRRTVTAARKAAAAAAAARGEAPVDPANKMAKAAVMSSPSRGGNAAYAAGATAAVAVASAASAFTQQQQQAVPQAAAAAKPQQPGQSPSKRPTENATRGKDPQQNASDEMKNMANNMVLPTKDMPLSKQQLDSFHRFHDFLIRTTKGSGSPSPGPLDDGMMMMQPLMTASSDEFTSECRSPVMVKRRSASVPHDRNLRWVQQQDEKLQQLRQAQAVACVAAESGEMLAVPPPAKRATGTNRQGPCRTGTVEKRPLAATSTFDVDMQTESNNDTPLTLACSNGHTAMVELLVQRGANVHHRDKKGFTPLILAATGGHIDIVQLLLDNGANIETQSERTKDTALSLACSGGKREVAELLLKRGANKEHRNVSDYTPLSLAASGGYVDIVNMLLEAGAEINSRTGSKLGISPLMLAAMNGHKDATRVLLERGSDINAQIETNRNTALTLACFQGRTEVVRLLLSFNANVEHRAKTGLTPLMEAANGGYVEVGQLLLEAGADPNTSPVPSSRDTALTIAADKGHEKFVELLLKNGAAVDARNKKGCTALWLACHGGHLETVQTLVKYKKTNVEMEDNRKVSPLMIAFRKGHIKICKFLVKWVTQFPGDTELCRYIQTVTEQDLMTRCHECMNTIVTAKDKQAAQANLAADALIAQIEAEEEQARSKKASKQRQKEKKKAKKQEKKKVEEVKEEDSEEEEEEVPVAPPPKKEEPKKVGANSSRTAEAVAAAAGKSTPAAATRTTTMPVTKAMRSKMIATGPVADSPPPTETTPERQVERAEDRIPGLNLTPAAPVPAAAAAAEEPVQPTQPTARTAKTAADRRAANRRSRNESGKNNGAAPVLPMMSAAPQPLLQQQLRSPTTLQMQQAQALMSPMVSPRGAATAAATQEEWVKANKKGRNARNDKSTTAPTDRSSSSAGTKLTDPSDEGALIMWNNIEQSRRRMTTLTVSSPCIARVIGRGGANINAIREATGASIEVERVDKAISRRDNIDREICIRGTAETVKNAVAMINGLIAETDVTVNEIIRLVRNSASPSEQPRDFHATSAISSKMAAATAAAAGTIPAARPTSAAAPAAATSGGGNVWQQRMAARQAQDAAARPAAAPAAAAAAPTAPSPALTNRSAASSPATIRTSSPPKPLMEIPTPILENPPAPILATQQPQPVQQKQQVQQQQPEVVEAEPKSAVKTSVAAAPAAAAPAPTPIAPPKQHAEEAQDVRKAPGYRPAPIGPPAAAASAASSQSSVITPTTPEPVATSRPTALPTTPVHARVPDLAQHTVAAASSSDHHRYHNSPPEDVNGGMGMGGGVGGGMLTKQDSGSALFNDNTFRSIAEIWGDSSGDVSMLNSSTRSGGSANAFGGAWDGALGLNNTFNSLSLSKPDWAEYTTGNNTSSSAVESSTSSTSAFSAGLPTVAAAAAHHSAHSIQQTAAAAAYGHPAPADPYASSAQPQRNPLFARGANAGRSTIAAPAAPQKTSAGGSALDSIFNNVAAALLNHQSGGPSSTQPSTTSATASTAAPAAVNYYPSPSYTDPATMGLSGLKGYGIGNGNGVAAAYQQQQHNAFTRLATAQQQQQQARMNSNGYTTAPPPGFTQMNTAMPPPSLTRGAAPSYFTGQMQQQLGSAAAAAAAAQQQQSAFHLYASQNGWPTNGMPAKAQAPPTMNGGTTNGRPGSFYSNGWN